MHEKTRSPTRLSGMTALIANGKWAIKQEALRDIVQGFNAYLLSGPATSEKVLADIRAEHEARARQAALIEASEPEPRGVSVLTLYGTIFPRGSMFVWLCGAQDAHTFAQRVRQAADDDQVASIILDIDSGGGAVSGVDVAAAAVRYAASKKTTTAVVNTTACSAAYWIASGASEIVVTPAGEVGSIGVIGTHTDESAALSEEGLKVTYVRSAPRKALGQSAEPMEGEALAVWQGEIDRLRDLFVGEVATGRGQSVATVRNWATGDVWFGQEAVDEGLADRVGTLDLVLQEHLVQAQSSDRSPAQQAARTGEDTPPAGETPTEAPMRLELKDRTGKTYAIDTESPTALADLQGVLDACETSAFNAGHDKVLGSVSSALGIEPNQVTDDRLARLKAEAADGQTYRANLEQQVEQLATSVYGANSASIQMHVNLARAASIGDLKTLVDDLGARKAATFPAGRQSVDVPDEDPAQAEQPGAEAAEPRYDPALLD